MISRPLLLVSALLVSALLAAGVFWATPAQAQISSSVGGGISIPRGDLDDGYSQGITLRGQAALSLLLADVHAQVGFHRFPSKDGGTAEFGDNANLYHAGVGGRLGLGLLWVGLNGAYFFGDGENGIGYFPEVGAGLGAVEVVLDYRFDGDEKWLGLRAGLTF